MVSSDVFSPLSRYCSNCKRLVGEKDKYCPNCGHLCDENVLRECESDRCGNCQAFVPVDAKYCRNCGARVGEGKFDPSVNLMDCIYGPMPIKRSRRRKKRDRS